MLRGNLSVKGARVRRKISRNNINDDSSLRLSHFTTPIRPGKPVRMSTSSSANDLSFPQMEVQGEDLDFLDYITSPVLDDPLTPGGSWRWTTTNPTYQYQDQPEIPISSIDNSGLQLGPTNTGRSTTTTSTQDHPPPLQDPQTIPLVISSNSETEQTGSLFNPDSHPGVNQMQNVIPEQVVIFPAEEGSSKAVKVPKICKVCGDVAKSLHFGGLSCDSCKAFFRRAVHQDNEFKCLYNNSCVINMSTRKSCQSCRFKKCVKYGMEKKWVMTDEDRANFQKQRLGKKQKPETRPSGESQTQRENRESTAAETISAAHDPQKYEPQVSQMLNYMSTEDKGEIEYLVHKFHKSYEDIPYRVSQCPKNRNSIEIIEMFTTILRRMVYFHKDIPDFNEISANDQSTLLRQGVLEMCMLRSALTFDFTNSCWPKKTGNMEFLKKCPTLHIDDMKKLVSPDLYNLQMSFISGLQDLAADEPIVVLLTLIVLFYPDRIGLEDLDTVSRIQDKYLRYLKNYTLWRFGPDKGSKMYPKLLIKLSDLRQLNDSHNQYNLRLEKSQINQIQEQMSKINLNPYTQWDVVKCDLAQAVGHVGPVSLKPPPEIVVFQPPPPPPPLPPPTISGSIPTNFDSKCPTLRNPATVTVGHKTPGQIGSMSSPSALLDFFAHMANRQIPIFLENPLATLSVESELANVTNYFASQEGSSRLSKVSRTEEPSDSGQSQGHKFSQYAAMMGYPSDSVPTYHHPPPSNDFGQSVNLDTVERQGTMDVGQSVYPGGVNPVSYGHGLLDPALGDNFTLNPNSNVVIQPSVCIPPNYNMETNQQQFNYNQGQGEDQGQQQSSLEGLYYDNSSSSSSSTRVNEGLTSSPYSHLSQYPRKVPVPLNGNFPQETPIDYESSSRFFEQQQQSGHNYFEQPCSSSTNKNLYGETGKHCTDNNRRDKQIGNKWSGLVDNT